MKKLLALVLALVMTLSLCVVSSNAAYKDAADITHGEAVEMMSALGVINGKGDNKFDPKGNVTRAEMAKMITIIMLGDVDAAAFVGTATGLKDIAGHWAEGYIQYCYSQGVIAGKGNGIFDPNANVTAAEAAKMLLVAIGFDAAIQEYTGANWTLNVTRDAQLKGFYAELKSLTSGETLNRDKAAQMIWNAVQADGVKITKSWNNLDNKIGYTYNDTKSLLESTFGAVKVNGSLTDSKLVFSGDYKDKYAVKIGATTYYAAEDYSELLYQPVTLMYAENDDVAGYNPAKDNVLGVVAKYENAATELLARSAFSKSSDYKVKANGTVYTLDKTAKLVTVAVDGDVSAPGATSAAALVDKDSYGFLRFIDTDSTGKYDVVVYYDVVPAYVSYADSAKIIAGSSTYETDDYVIPAEIAKKDYVSMTFNFAEGTTEFAKLEKQNGKVTAVDTANSTATFGDVKVYNVAGLAAGAVTIGNTYDYYTINNVLVYNKQTTATALTSLVFLANLETSATSIAPKALVYFTDGTNKTVTIDETSSGALLTTGGSALTAGGFYKVTETSYGYKFTNLNGAADADFTDYDYDAGGTLAIGTSATVDADAVANSAVVFLWDATAKTCKVISGEQLKSLTADNATTVNHVATTALGHITTTVNGLTKVAYVGVKHTGGTWTGFNAAAVAANYALVTSAATNVYVDGSTYTTYTIFNGTDNLTVVDKVNTTYTAIPKFSIVAYSSIDADGYIKDATVAAFNGDTAAEDATAQLAAGALTGYELNNNNYYVLTVDGDEVFTCDAKTVFMTINSAASAANEIGMSKTAEVVLADKLFTGIYAQNVLVYADVAGTARVVVFDATNRLATKAAHSFDLTNATGKFVVYDANGDVVATGTNNVKAGDILTITNETSGALNLTVTGVKTADAALAAVSSSSVAAGKSVVVVVDGTGDVAVTNV